MSQQAAVDTIWYTRCPVPTPLGLAAQLGWFASEFERDGITIKTLQETNDPTLRESHYDHHLDHSFRQGGNVPAIWARAQGRETRVIGLNWIDEAQLIITLPDSGIRDPKDLKGRKLGLPVHHNTIDHGRAGALRGFLVTLETAGLAYADAEFVDIESSESFINLPSSEGGSGSRRGGRYQDVIAALHSGVVDAVFVKGARGLDVAQSNGLHIVTDIRNHPDPLVRANNGAPRPITVDAAFLEARPDLVARFLARIVDIGDWAASHATETVAYIANETSSSSDWVKQAYGNDVHLHQTTDLSELSIKALDGYKNFLYQWGFIKHDFDTNAWIDHRSLAEVVRNQSIRNAA